MSENKITETKNALKTVKFEISDNQPDSERINLYQRIPVENKRVSQAEMNEALKWMGMAIVAAIAGWFFGRWVIRGFRGPGVLFFGYLPAYAMPPAMLVVFLMQINLLVRSARKKSPEAAFSWLWKTSYFGVDSFSDERFGDLEFAVGAAMRALPNGLNVPEAAVRAYVAEFRKQLGAALDDAKSPAISSDWAEGKPHLELTVKSKTNLADGAVVLEETIAGTDIRKWRHDNKTDQIAAAKFELNIRQVYVRSGKYWFAADPLPQIRRIA